MTLKFMGKKRGMIQLFDKEGNAVPCTVIEAEPNVVTQVKTKATDGYEAVQLAFDERKVKDPRTMEKRVTKPILEDFKKKGIAPRRSRKESRVENASEYAIGQEIGVDLFDDVGHVDVMALSKGKGFQGVMKLYNFRGGPAAHGSGFHRHAGSTGMRSTPGRCLPGGKRASHMGYDQVTVQNIKVVRIIPEENLIILKGQVPGPRNGLVCLSQAVKKQKKAQKHK